MKRLASVFLFLIMAALAFWGILHYARHLEVVKEEKKNPSEYVTVYTDMPSGMLEGLSPSFFKDTGLKINIVYLSSDQMLRADGGGTDTPAADMYITSQDGLMKLKKGEFLAPYSSAQTDTALNLFKDEECYWTGLWVDPVVFAVNRDYADRHPAFSYNWNEVLTRNSVRLSMTDFMAADMAGDLLMCLVEHFGLEDTFRYLGIAQNHMVQYGKFLSTPSRMAGMGKCDIGISGLNEALRSVKDKMPIRIMYPEDGSPWYLFGAGISAHGQYPERAKVLMDWLLSSSSYKKDMEENRYYYIYVNDYTLEPDAAGNFLQFWNLEKEYFDEGKKDLLTRWGEKIRFGGTNS
ncbi:substrate-binding domain-containing protein [uncultured Dialister sp.]|jgi:iron(III) transport system substrate-binding protein|uniref:ABC transporter substrate-binding protein n=1 Tax=uncultured Dialister sp. TaxID=278064 RepID=UPI00262EDA0B|nr:substrate-binding domain-containing protein [uncultured Dialister sp.]